MKVGLRTLIEHGVGAENLWVPRMSSDPAQLDFRRCEVSPTKVVSMPKPHPRPLIWSSVDAHAVTRWSSTRWPDATTPTGSV